MALSIKSDEADRLARELAEATGETITQAIVSALRERLERSREPARMGIVERVNRLAQDVRDLPVHDGRPTDELVAYDEAGLPV